jgi:SAM-dependent methyltransferase
VVPEGDVEKGTDNGDMTERIDWGSKAQKGFLASGIDPSDRRGYKNTYIDLLQKMALEQVLQLRGDESVLDFGCGSGRISHWIAPRVKEVVGLELTPEMIDVAERHRQAENVRFLLYDGIHFPNLPGPLDLILSVGVLQVLQGISLRRTIRELSGFLKAGGRFFLIEQVSDRPAIGRPRLEDYLHAFREAALECTDYHPIRKGRWWLLYLIRYGLIPKSWFPSLAAWELKMRRVRRRKISYYEDYLFLTVKR